ncbi:MAG: restriction endonuclease subunit S [Bacilli bacterium]|nr:restriction endonuclease subunit S [Bacilli bacterium]
MLGDLFKISAGGDIDRSKVSEKKDNIYKYPIIANALSNNGIYGYTDTYKRENCVTVTGRGDIGIAVARPYKYYPIVRLLSLSPKSNADLKYFESLINSKKILNESTGVPQLTSPQISKLKIHYCDYEEQTKIGNFLSLIDERIETQNKIIKELKSLIKPLFESFNVEDLIPYRLTELGEYRSSETMSWDDMSEKGTPTIIYGQLFTDYSLVIKNVIGYSLKNGCLSTGNDILFPASTTVDNLSLISPASLKIKGVNLGGDMFILSLFDWIDSDYLSLLINLRHKNDLAKLAQGSTIIHLRWNDIADFKVQLPSLSEQRKISHACKCVLEKIEIEKQILEKLIIQKRFLLHNLFI